MEIIVLSGEIKISDVTEALLENGLVVVETTRPHAKKVFNETIDVLGIDIESQDPPSIFHSSTETCNGGWSSFFVLSPPYEYWPDQTKTRVVEAVEAWDKAGFPDYFSAKIVG